MTVDEQTNPSSLFCAFLQIMALATKPQITCLYMPC